MLGDGFGVVIQYFRPRPRRFITPDGSGVSVQRLWTERFFVVVRIIDCYCCTVCF